MNIESLLKKTLTKLVGQQCWAVVGGKGTGSVISLNFGEKIPRINPIKNPHISEDARKYDSSLGLMVHCPWRIESKKTLFAVVTTQMKKMVHTKSDLSIYLGKLLNMSSVLAQHMI